MPRLLQELKSYQACYIDQAEGYYKNCIYIYCLTVILKQPRNTVPFAAKEHSNFFLSECMLQLSLSK